MISQNNKNIKAILSVYNNKEIIRVTDTISGEIVWEKIVIPAEIDYFYVQNTYNGTNTLTVQQTLTGTLDSNTYAKQIEYSKDKTNWTTITLSSTGYTISINQGEKVYFRGDEGVFNYWYSGGTNKAITTLNCSQQYIIGGNINTLLDYNNPNSLTLPQGAFNSIFENDTNLTSASEVTLPPSVDGSISTYVYCYLFRGCTGLITAPKSIPATKQGNASCYGMFRACSSLTTAPTLPATTLAGNCYTGMFYGCNSLTTAPELPATTLASRCYPDMFSGCTSLTQAPNLPATTLTDGCYYQMFRNCSSLTTAPTIQATTLAGNCCNAMFYGCVKLTKAPTLLATTLANYSYNQMFYGCSKLNEVTTYAEDISAVDCLNNWLYGVASSGTFYNNGSANFTINSASGIPTGWTNVVPGSGEIDYFYIENLYDGTNTLTLSSEISSISPSTSSRYSDTVEYSKDKNNWTTVNFDTSTPYNIRMNSGEKVYFRNDSGRWNYYVSSDDDSKSRYFYTYFNTSRDCGAGGDLRSILNYKDINNVTLTEGCFNHLFYYCEKLKIAPELRATTLAEHCYRSLFYGCSSLTTAPTLPATTLKSRCYYHMYWGCTSLNEVTTYANDISAVDCTKSWLSFVASTGTFRNLGSANFTVNSASGIPSGWTVVTE